MAAAAKTIAWLEFWAEIGPAILDFGKALYRQTNGDPDGARATIARLQTDLPKFTAARDETQQGFAKLKDDIAQAEAEQAAERTEQPPDEQAPEPEPDNEYVDPESHAPR